MGYAQVCARERVCLPCEGSGWGWGGVGLAGLDLTRGMLNGGTHPLLTVPPKYSSRGCLCRSEACGTP